MTQLIVDFRVGTSEDHARAAITRNGGMVKRKMRSDDPTRIRLLATFESEANVAKIGKEISVERTEVDGENFRAS